MDMQSVQWNFSEWRGFCCTWLKSKSKVKVCREGECVGVDRRLLCAAAGVVLQRPWTHSSSCDAGGWWASCPHISLAPPSLEETLRSWGGLQKHAGNMTGNKPCLGMWRGSLGRRQQFVCESDVRFRMISKRFYPCITSSISLLQRLPLGFYSWRTWVSKHWTLGNKDRGLSHFQTWQDQESGCCYPNGGGFQRSL